jgi:ParB family chromosome partitioning protein
MADTSTAYEKGKLYELELTRLQTDPSQPRKYMDPQAMEEMTVSVAKHGILEPILFRVAEGILYVVAGERRVEAAKKAGLTTIPAIFVEGNHAEIALVENLLRQDLTPVEEAEALDRLLQEQQYTHEQLAAMIGKARNTLTEIPRKKQDRSMITAWNQYKDKLAKAAEGRKKRANVPESAVDIFKWVSKAVAKLEGLDTSAWTEDEKNTLNQTLQNLHESIQAILNPPAASRNLA